MKFNVPFTNAICEIQAEGIWIWSLSKLLVYPETSNYLNASELIEQTIKSNHHEQLPSPPLNHILKCHIHTLLKYFQGWQTYHFPEKPVPGPNNTHFNLRISSWHLILTSPGSISGCCLILSLVTWEKRQHPTCYNLLSGSCRVMRSLRQPPLQTK